MYYSLTIWLFSAESTAAVIGGLESGRAYEVLILAGNEGGVEQVGSRLIMTTLSTTENVVEDPSLGVNGTIIAGASAGAVLILLVVIIAVVVVIRRRQKRINAQIEEFGGASSMVRLDFPLLRVAYSMCYCRRP